MALDCGLNTTGPANTTAQKFFVTYCITFTFLLLCLVPFWVHLVTGHDNLWKLHCFNIFTSVFVKIFCIWNIITGLYQVACQCGHSPAPMPKLKRDKCELNHKLTQIAPPIKQLKSPADTTSEGETPVSQVAPLLGTKPSENNHIQHRNMPKDISDILGTRVYQGI